MEHYFTSVLNLQIRGKVRLQRCGERAKLKQAKIRSKCRARKPKGLSKPKSSEAFITSSCLVCSRDTGDA